MTDDEKLQRAYNALLLARINLSPGNYQNLNRDMLVNNTKTVLRILDVALEYLDRPS